MTVRSLRASMFAGLTTLLLFASAGVGVARAQEGPIDHLRHRTHQIVRATDRVIRGHRPRPVVVRVYEPRHHRHYYRVRHYDRRHHRYYYTYRRY